MNVSAEMAAGLQSDGIVYFLLGRTEMMKLQR